MIMYPMYNMPLCRFLCFTLDGFGDPSETERAKLKKFDFPLNKMENNVYRDIFLHDNKRVEDYPIIHDDLAVYASCMRFKLQFEPPVKQRNKRIN